MIPESLNNDIYNRPATKKHSTANYEPGTNNQSEMKKFRLNHYERAFGNWLIDSNVPYTAVDEQKRAAFGRSKFKSFDYLLYPPGEKIIIAEVKGRKLQEPKAHPAKHIRLW